MIITSQESMKRSAEEYDESQDSKRLKNDDEAEASNSIPKSELFKPPTVEELNQLRETEILFNSNLFRLQTEELIKEIKIKQRRRREIELWFENFQRFIKNLPEHTDNKLSDFNLCLEQENQTLKKNFKKIAKNNPLPQKSDLNSHINLTKPVTAQLVGLYPINATVNPKICVVLNVTIPETYFAGKDRLNARYLIKRSLYLSYLATNLAGSDLATSISYAHFNGNHLLPILEIEPVAVKNTTVKLVVTPEEDTFKLSRFDCTRSNMRCTYFSTVFSTNVENPEEELVTPVYNAAVLNDLTLVSNDTFRRNLIKDMKGACEGLMLLSVWLRQRELSDGYGGFSEDLMYSLLAYLAQSNKINKHMSSYQVIRNVWNHLAQSNWESQGPTMNNSADLNQFHSCYDVVFVDKSGYYNLAANLELNVYLRIKHEAKLALVYLDEGKINSFHSLFINKMKFYMQFDAVINIPNSPVLINMYEKANDKSKVDHLHFKYPLILKEILNLLRYGLSDRAVCFTPKLKTNILWKPGTKVDLDDTSITIGIQLDSSNLYRVVDKGPAAYDPLAVRFREFWGDKAELRRFKDGSIFEAVYWPTDVLQEKRIVCRNIIEYVLKEKIKLENYSIVYNQFENILQLFNKPAVEEANLKVINEFDNLAKILRDLKLPLSISNIQGTSESFYHSDAFPPTPTNYETLDNVSVVVRNNIVFQEGVNVKSAPKYVAPVHGIIEMVHHSKWPNNVEAMKNLRSAFYLQIADTLSQQDNVSCNVTHDYLDVLYHGLVFRLVIFHPKQVALMKKQIDETGMVFYRDTPESMQLEKDFVVLPKIIGALSGVHAQFPSYGPATALIKRWLNAQLLDESHIPQLVIALLSASTYLDSSPYSVPVLPCMAFLRFLAFLANHNFITSAVIVNFNGELTKEELSETESAFQQNREEYPPLTIITPYDSNSLFTSYAPTKEIIFRMSILAKESLNIIEKNIYTQNIFNEMTLFTPNMSGYNVIIELKMQFSSRKEQYICSKVKKSKLEMFEERDKNLIPIISFDPIDLYLQELRTNYDEFALFFRDSYGGNTIAVLWRPEIFQKTEFKVSEIVDGKKVVSKEGKLQVNVDAIVEDFFILGKGIVKNINKF